MRLPPIPGPRDVVHLLERVTGLLGNAEHLLASAEALVQRIEQTRAGADEVVARTAATVTGADELVQRILPTLDRLQPSLDQLAPTLERLAETTDPDEVDAMVALVDHLPLLVGKLETEVVPILETLSTVAPDLHDLLDTSKELNEMLAKLPGMGRIKERVERQQEIEGRG